MKDFSLLRDSKTTRFPHGFMAELEKRMTGIMMGREKRAEYHDATVKRSFAAALNAFMEAGFKKRMEKDRRSEDLVLIFYSNATKVLQAGKAPSDDSWKFMVDRHVALFVRLITLILKDEDWSKDRPELTSRLATLESKLLAHDRDLAADSSTGLGSTVEVVAQLSYEVKDMPLVQVVGNIFGLTNTQIQSDIDKNKTIWTEKAALQDLKTYQTLLSLNSKNTLTSDDFDLEESYELWRKAEAPDLSQMMLAIVQANPELAKTTNVHQNPQINTTSIRPERSDSTYSESQRKYFEQPDGSPYVFDQPVDMSTLSPASDKQSNPFEDTDHSFTFIPPEPRAFYRLILSQALSHDLKDETLHPSESVAGSNSIKILSKQSTELLNELCLRWRIPFVSRIILFLDVCREKFLEQDLSLETLNSAFEFTKEPPPENKKDNHFMSSLLFDRTKWTLADFALNQQLLLALHEALLRDLYSVATMCYETKPPSVGLILFVWENHIFSDPSFPKTEDELDGFKTNLLQGLRAKARFKYQELMAKHLPQDETSWEFYHVIELGRSVRNLSERTQKRYRKNPEIMG